jgi:hypothetical protein
MAFKAVLQVKIDPIEFDSVQLDKDTQILAVDEMLASGPENAEYIATLDDDVISYVILRYPEAFSYLPYTGEMFELYVQYMTKVSKSSITEHELLRLFCTYYTHPDSLIELTVLRVRNDSAKYELDPRFNAEIFFDYDIDQLEYILPRSIFRQYFHFMNYTNIRFVELSSIPRLKDYDAINHMQAVLVYDMTFNQITYAKWAQIVEKLYGSDFSLEILRMEVELIKSCPDKIKFYDLQLSYYWDRILDRSSLREAIKLNELDDATMEKIINANGRHWFKFYFMCIMMVVFSVLIAVIKIPNND